MTREFKYDGKNRNVVVFHEARDEKDKVIEFDGIDLSYLEPEAAVACKAFFAEKEVKPFPAKGTKAEKIEGADAAWFKAYRRFKENKIEKEEE